MTSGLLALLAHWSVHQEL